MFIEWSEDKLGSDGSKRLYTKPVHVRAGSTSNMQVMCKTCPSGDCSWSCMRLAGRPLRLVDLQIFAEPRTTTGQYLIHLLYPRDELMAARR